MTTKIVEGSIVDSTADIIVHQVNCQFVMGSGVAKALRDRFKNLYPAYLSMQDKRHVAITSEYLGKIQLVTVYPDDTENSKFVCNLFGQNKYGNDGKQYTNYQAIECGLYALKREILFGEAKYYTESISFPWNMGAARGGGDWNVIKAMIETVFGDTDIEIIYYKHSQTC